MRVSRLALALFLALVPSVGWAAIAFDVVNLGASGTGNLSWTHTPTGTPRGVIVWCGHQGSTDEVSTVTYGGVSMVNVPGSPLSKATGENGTVHAFFLGVSVPTGAQTVSITVTGATFKRCSSYTVTAAADTSVDATDIFTSDSVEDPSDSVVTTAGVTTFITVAGMFGFDVLGSSGVGSGYTPVLDSDLGTMVLHYARRTSLGTGGSITYSWSTTGAEDAILMAVALREGTAAPSTCAGRKMLRGFGKC